MRLIMASLFHGVCDDMLHCGSSKSVELTKALEAEGSAIDDVAGACAWLVAHGYERATRWRSGSFRGFLIFVL